MDYDVKKAELAEATAKVMRTGETDLTKWLGKTDDKSVIASHQIFIGKVSKVSFSHVGEKETLLIKFIMTTKDGKFKNHAFEIFAIPGFAKDGGFTFMKTNLEFQLGSKYEAPSFATFLKATALSVKKDGDVKHIIFDNDKQDQYLVKQYTKLVGTVVSVCLYPAMPKDGFEYNYYYSMTKKDLDKTALIIKDGGSKKLDTTSMDDMAKDLEEFEKSLTV